MVKMCRIRLGLRLCVILTVVIVQYNLVIKGIAAAQLVVEPLWETPVNSTPPCGIQDTHPDGEGQTVFFHGNPRMTCSIHISASEPSTRLEISFPQTAINESLLLFVERMGDLEKCPNKYVLIDGQSVCLAVFSHTNLRLDLQGNGSVALRVNADLDPLCPEMVHGIQVSPTEDQLGCHKVRGYEFKIQCAQSYWDPGLCTPEWQSPCNASLGNREVVLKCANRDRNKIAMMFYPDGITTLVLRSRKIRNLDVMAFEGLKFLEVLYLDGNLLETLKRGVFTPVKYLTALDLHENNIATLEPGVFHDLRYLTHLVLYRNRIATVDADVMLGLSSLVYFDFDENMLSALPVGMFMEQSSLIRLYFQINNLVELNATVFHGLKNLYLLALSENGLRYLPAGLFSTMSKLGMLVLNENEIAALDSMMFKGLPYLFYLDLDDNRVSSLPGDVFAGNPELQILYLHKNYLETLNASIFKNLKQLTLLGMRRNDLSSVPEGLLSNLANLDELHLDENQLVSVNSNLFIGIDKLSMLYLGANRLVNLNGQVFRNLSLLTFLSLNENRLSTLTGGPFMGLHSLRDIVLYGNQLVSIDQDTFEGLSNLIYIDLNDNLLLTLHNGLFQGLTNLRKLRLADNQLDTVHSKTFQGLHNLIELTLTRNGLVTFDAGLFKGLGQLYTLSLNDNNMTTLPAAGAFTDLNHLNGLFLNGNQLKSLTPGVFYGMENLKGLFLYDNKLVEIPDGVFYGLDNLITLFLQTNQLTVLGGRVFQGLHLLKYIFLAVNQLELVDKNIFQDTANLTVLELSKNRLKDVPNLDQFTSLDILNLKDNPLTMTSSDSFKGLQGNPELTVSQHEICVCFIPAGVNCSAANNRSPYLTCDRLLSDRVLMAMMWIIGINALAGNVYVLVWRVKNAQRNKVQDLLLSNLALSDLLMGTYMLIIASADAYFGGYFPMQSEAWRSGITCKVAGAISITSSEASVFFVMLISIDRYINIRFPYSTRKLSKGVTLIAVISIWCFAAVLGIVPSVLAGQWFKFYDNSHVCIGLPLALIKQYSPVIESPSYRYLDEIDWFFIPSDKFSTNYEGLANGLYFSSAVFLGLNCACYLVILFCYIEIVRSVRRSSKQSGRSRDMIEEIRLTTKVTAIVATDFCCWFPVIILGILVQARVFELPPSVYAWMVTFVLPINSAINPYMYTFADIVSNYRKKQNEKRMRKQQVAQHALQQAHLQEKVPPTSFSEEKSVPTATISSMVNTIGYAN